MEALFPKHTYEKRRLELAGKLEGGTAFFPGNGESPMNYRANVYPFRQDSNFLYYFGLDLPGLAGAIDIDSGESVIFGDEQTMDDIIWMGKQETLQDLAVKVGVARVLPLSSLENFGKGRNNHLIPPYRPEHKAMIGKFTGDHTPANPSEELIHAIVEQRSLKSNEELDEMESALDVTAQMHIAVMKGCLEGESELSLASAAHAIAQAHGRQLAYPIILTTNGEVLHNHHYSNKLHKGNIVLADIGCDSPLHYAADITRSTPVGLRFDDRQRDIYTLVLQAQMAAIEAIRESVSFRDLHLLSARVIVDGMKELGLMKGDTAEAVAGGAHALFFPHGLGHMIGLDVHDMEALGEDYVGYDKEYVRSDQFDLAFLRMGRKLKKGMVVTVEPGIYFIPALMDKWQAGGKFADFINYEKLRGYRNFGGIRIEDNIVVDYENGRILGKPIPKKISEIEALRG